MLQGDILVIEFTYKVPDEVTYLAVVIMRLKGKVNDALISILSKSKCSIITSSSYSQCRWNAYYTTVEFAVALVDYDNAMRLMDKTTEEIVRKVCDEVMPQKAGFDVMEVKLSIS